MWVIGVVEFGSGKEVACVGKLRNGFASDRIPAGMVKMQMRVDDNGDVVGPAAGDFKERLGKRLFSKDPVHPRFLFGPFLANARFDQYAFGRSFYENAIHVQPDAIQIIGRANTLPKNARDDSEHRPSV